MNPGNGVRSARRRLRAVLIVGTAAAVFANTNHAQQLPSEQVVASTPPTKAPERQEPRQEGDGERVFAENCSRCHTVPDGFSQRISGTIIRHMRVRASLSEQEEKALLLFLNPQ